MTSASEDAPEKGQGEKYSDLFFLLSSRRSKSKTGTVKVSWVTEGTGMSLGI